MPINLKTHIQMQSRLIDYKLPRLQDNIEKGGWTYEEVCSGIAKCIVVLWVF